MSWPSNDLENWPEGHDSQGLVHLTISSTFVKHLERLFTPKNQDNSEKGYLVETQTFNSQLSPSVIVNLCPNHFFVGKWSSQRCCSNEKVKFQVWGKKTVLVVQIYFNQVQMAINQEKNPSACISSLKYRETWKKDRSKLDT